MDTERMRGVEGYSTAIRLLREAADEIDRLRDEREFWRTHALRVEPLLGLVEVNEGVALEGEDNELDCVCHHPQGSHERVVDARFGAWYDNCIECGCSFLSRDQESAR